MNYLKYTPYVYLVFGAYFIYEGCVKLKNPEFPFLSFIIGGVAIFMFFFRKKYAEKFDERNKKR